VVLLIRSRLGAVQLAKPAAPAVQTPKRAKCLNEPVYRSNIERIVLLDNNLWSLLDIPNYPAAEMQYKLSYLYIQELVANSFKVSIRSYRGRNKSDNVLTPKDYHARDHTRIAQACRPAPPWTFNISRSF
jgi:hypothetical protein